MPRLIDAEATKSLIYISPPAWGRERDLMRVIDSVPTIDAEPVRHGRWEDIKGAIRCSECQNTPLYDYHGRLVLADRCHVCGAKMWKKGSGENEGD